MCNGDDLILHPLFNFEPMKGLEHWGDVRMFGSASNSACKSILNRLKALKPMHEQVAISLVQCVCLCVFACACVCMCVTKAAQKCTPVRLMCAELLFNNSKSKGNSK